MENYKQETDWEEINEVFEIYSMGEVDKFVLISLANEHHFIHISRLSSGV